MSSSLRLPYVLRSWRRIVAPTWLPPVWAHVPRVRFYVICMLAAGLNLVMRSVEPIPGLLAFAYFAAGAGVTMAKPRPPVAT